MNIGTKITWAYRLLFIVTLLWLRFIEQYLPIGYMWVVWAIIVVLWLFNPFSKKKSTPQTEEITGS